MSDSGPKGLPPLKVQQDTSAIKRVDDCQKCGNKLRVVSNYLGVHAHCDNCKDSFPVASTARRVEPALNLPRGLHKRTLVEPDWGKAFEEIGDASDDKNQ